MHILHVVGARPNFMKLAPVLTGLASKANVHQTLVHTGQHYDKNMSDIFFQQLNLPKPDINLEVGSGSHAFQTAQIMMRFEKVVQEQKPDWVMVYGDVNSTVAAALVCAKVWIPLAHVEAGLRSFDRTMPEEINRLVTDQLASLLFTPSTDGNENLRNESVDEKKVRFVGNVMIDTLIRLLPEAEKVQFPQASKEYVLVTLHRPSNVDDSRILGKIIETLLSFSQDISILFPIHPRTRKAMKDWGIKIPDNSNIHLLDPVGYIEFLSLQKNAKLVITDSGGVQEETTFLSVPCLTLRENTERPVTVTLGTNVLIGHNMPVLKEEVLKILNGNAKESKIPPLWDGRAGERIADIMVQYA